MSDVYRSLLSPPFLPSSLLEQRPSSTPKRKEKRHLPNGRRDTRTPRRREERHSESSRVKQRQPLRKPKRLPRRRRMRQRTPSKRKDGGNLDPLTRAWPPLLPSRSPLPYSEKLDQRTKKRTSPHNKISSRPNMAFKPDSIR